MTESLKSEAKPSEGTAEKKQRWTIGRVAVFVGGGFTLFVVLVFVIALILAFIDVETLGRVVEVFRDLFIIVLAFSSILIVVALAVLIAQIARLINLFQQGFGSIVEDLQETTQAARGTAEFVSKNVADPVIKAGGILAGTGVFLREVGGLRRAIRSKPTADAGLAEVKRDG